MPTLRKLKELQSQRTSRSFSLQKSCFLADALKAHPPPNKWTLENLNATFDNNKVLKIIFTNDKNEI